MGRSTCRALPGRMPSTPRLLLRAHAPAWLRVGAGVGLAVPAFLLRLAMEPIVGLTAPWATLFFSTLLASVAGGALAGASATLTGFVLVEFFMLPPRLQFSPYGPDAFGGFLYLGVAAAIVWVGALLRTTLARAEAALRDLEAERAHLQAEAVARAQAEQERARFAGQERAARQQLEATVAEMNAIFETAPVGLAVARDADCRSIQMNAWLADVLGVPPGAEGSKTGPDAGRLGFRVFRDDVEVPGDELPMQRAAGRGVVVRNEVIEIRRTDGRRIELVSNAIPLRAEDGRIRGCVGTFVDSTALRRAEERFRAAQEQSLFGFAIVRSIRDAAGTIVDFDWEYVNPAGARMLSRRPDELAGHRLHDVMPGVHGASPIFAVARQVVETRHAADIETFYDADGIRGWFRLSVTPLGDGVAVSFMDTTERKRLEAELSQRAEQLADADRRKDEFLAMLAHELRNPLGPIRNAVHVLRLRGPQEPTADRAHAMIERQVAHMVRLIDDLLDVSRITRGKITLRREVVDLGRVVDQAIELARPALDRQEHVLTVSPAPLPVLLEADPARLVQVIANLLTNAAKFTPARGRVTVTMERVGGDVVVRVRDTGVGIPADVLPHVFDLFTQEVSGPDRAQGGLGIGLTLVRLLVEMHGGRVEARSAGRGRGSEFVVTLPALPTADGSPDAPRGAEPTTLGAPRGLRVLLVEDNADAAESFAMLLRISGHAVEVASDGLAAVDLAVRHGPDVAFVDLGLPGIDGFEVARRLRRLPGCAGVVLIALSGYGRDEDKRRAREAGFDHHLTKPADLAAVDRLLGDVGPLRVA